MNKLSISLGQMDVLLGRPEANIQQVRTWTAEAARRGSQLVLFPELWATGYALEQAVALATPIAAGPFAETARLARQHSIHIYGSGLARGADGRIRNTAVLDGTAGNALGSYSKIHLFRLMQEDQFLAAGDRPVIAASPWGDVGLAICYDLRFPELFRAYAVRGARLILLVAEWPYPRRAHWETLLRARAVENQLYLVACNRVGTSAGSTFFGASCIIDPWGEFVLAAGEQPGLFTAEIDLDKVDEVRRRIPALADRRPEVYEA
jgi:predicted amidohydrolase